MPSSPAIHDSLNSAARLTAQTLEAAGLKGQAEAIQRLIPVEDESCTAKLLMVLRAIEATTRMEWAAKGTVKTTGIATALDAVATCYLVATSATTAIDVDMTWLLQLTTRIMHLCERARLLAQAEPK